jgi:hypothetical protein
MMAMMRDSTKLIEAIWSVEDAIITLWHGRQVGVKKGDTVFYYQGPTQMMFVEVVSDDDDTDEDETES